MDRRSPATAPPSTVAGEIKKSLFFVPFSHRISLRGYKHRDLNQNRAKVRKPFGFSFSGEPEVGAVEQVMVVDSRGGTHRGPGFLGEV
ncbi:hypothetical protein V6Z12_A02G197600 [Gossypium hirsutum]